MANDKTASEMVREEANRLARSDESVRLRAANAVIQNTSWGKDVTPARRMALEKIANALGLSVTQGHVIMMGGNPYITIGGLLSYAHNKGGGIGLFDEGPLLKDDWDTWGVAKDALFAWKCTVKRKDDEVAYTEVGWAGGKREEKQPVARQFAAELARKRGRARALNLSHPTGLTSFEEVAAGGVEIPDEMMQRIEKKREEIKTEAKPIIMADIKRKFAEVAGCSEDEAEEWYGDYFGHPITQATPETIKEFMGVASEQAAKRTETEPAQEPAGQGEMKLEG